MGALDATTIKCQSHGDSVAAYIYVSREEKRREGQILACGQKSDLEKKVLHHIKVVLGGVTFQTVIRWTRQRIQFN